MFAVRNFLRTNQSIVKNVVQQRNMSVIATPARNKITKGETIFLASLMLVSWVSIPAWVLVNMKNYRNKE